MKVRVKYRPRRLLCFDLENRPLAYWYDGNPTSEITAFGWKWSDEDHVSTMLLRRDGRFAVDTPHAAPKTVSDAGAYALFVSVLRSADICYGHNIRRHDLPMLNAGLMRRSLPMLTPIRTTDTYKDLPRTAGVSKSLENMAAMYGLEGEKVKMTQPDWEHANRLTPDGLELARERVVGDVLLQERLRGHLKDELGILKPPRRWYP